MVERVGVSPVSALYRFFKRKLGTDAVPDHMVSLILTLRAVRTNIDRIAS
jgi:hypothetical protein